MTNKSVQQAKMVSPVLIIAQSEMETNGQLSKSSSKNIMEMIDQLLESIRIREQMLIPRLMLDIETLIEIIDGEDIRDTFLDYTVDNVEDLVKHLSDLEYKTYPSFKEQTEHEKQSIKALCNNGWLINMLKEVG